MLHGITIPEEIWLKHQKEFKNQFQFNKRSIGIPIAIYQDKKTPPVYYSESFLKALREKPYLAALEKILIPALSNLVLEYTRDYEEYLNISRANKASIINKLSSNMNHPLVNGAQDDALSTNNESIINRITITSRFLLKEAKKFLSPFNLSSSNQPTTVTSPTENKLAQALKILEKSSLLNEQDIKYFLKNWLCQYAASGLYLKSKDSLLSSQSPLRKTFEEILGPNEVKRFIQLRISRLLEEEKKPQRSFSSSTSVNSREVKLRDTQTPPLTLDTLRNILAELLSQNKALLGLSDTAINKLHIPEPDSWNPKKLVHFKQWLADYWDKEKGEVLHNLLERLKISLEPFERVLGHDIYNFLATVAPLTLGMDKTPEELKTRFGTFFQHPVTSVPNEIKEPAQFKSALLAALKILPPEKYSNAIQAIQGHSSNKGAQTPQEISQILAATVEAPEGTDPIETLEKYLLSLKQQFTSIPGPGHAQVNQTIQQGLKCINLLKTPEQLNDLEGKKIKMT